MTTIEFQRESALIPRKVDNPTYQRWLVRYGPWAMVTGASSGIGREVANLLAQAGFNLVLVARRETLLQEMAQDMQAQYGRQVRTLAADLAEAAEVERVIAETARLDVGLLIASAGFGTSGLFLDGSIEAEIDMLNVNCRALMMLTHAFGNRFAARGKGGIVLLSSIVAFQGVPYSAHYSATKGYVQLLAEALREELSSTKVDVLSVAPGPTNSGFATRAGMTMGAALDPKDLAYPIMNSLGRRATVFPGFLSKLLGYGLGTLPRWAKVKIMGNVMQGMSGH